MAEPEWTVATLKEHIDALRRADAGAIAGFMEQARRAADKADEAMERRLEGINEFRAAMNDQAQRHETALASFVPRQEYEQRHMVVSSQLLTLTGRIERNEARGTGMGNLAQVVFQIVLAVTAIGALIVALMRH